MVNITGKTILITGATSGIGLATAYALAEKGASIVLAGRNEVRSQQAAIKIRQTTSNNRVDYILADLSSQADIRKMAQEYLRRYDQLDVLINNAGAHFFKRQLSQDHVEMTFAVNHLAPFLLTNLLLPQLLAAAHNTGEARVINVSSNGHFGGQLDFSDLMFERRPYFFGWPAYKQSKLSNVLFSAELDRRLQGSQVRSFSLHPGLVPTNIFKLDDGILKSIVKIFVKRFGISEQAGALTSIYLASAPDVISGGGKYFEKCRPVAADAASQDKEMSAHLWQISSTLTNFN